VYANPRAGLVDEVAAGRAPDTALLGSNHLAGFGIDAVVHDPALMRSRLPMPFRLRWHLRELGLPWEVGDADVLCTPLANILPLVAGVRHLPVVVVNYGLNLIAARSSRARRRVLAASLRSAAWVLCLGGSQRVELLELIELPPERVVTVPFGVDEHFFAPSPQPANGYVLSVGRDLARDYVTLAGAVTGLAAHVIVVAEPRNLVGVRLPDNVEIRSGISHVALRDLYREAACVVLPMRRDGYRYGSEASGLTAFLEAAASSRAIVASERAILRDYVDPGTTALTVPPEDPSALRVALDRALDDHTLAARLGAAARRAVEQRFTTRLLASRLAPLIESAARS
jgi:glycosyltransferase involved in cell wall biosynthesis